MRPAGRPEIGQPINVRLGDKLLAAVSTYAKGQHISRAEAIRLLLADALGCHLCECGLIWQGEHLEK